MGFMGRIDKGTKEAVAEKRGKTWNWALQALRASGSSRGLDEGVVALVLMHMCLALSLLHENEIIHRDIKV